MWEEASVRQRQAARGGGGLVDAGGGRTATPQQGCRPPKRARGGGLGGGTGRRGGGIVTTGPWPGPPVDVGEPGEDGVHLGSHVPPGRRGCRVRRGLAGGVVVPHPAPLVHRRAVGPAGGCLSRE